MILSSKIKEFIRDHARESNPMECCGLIVEKIDKSIIPIKCENDALDKINFFRISCLDYLRASREGKIKASYHSHVEYNQFSELDKRTSRGLKLTFILYVISENAFLEYDPSLAAKKDNRVLEL